MTFLPLKSSDFHSKFVISDCVQLCFEDMM